MPISDQSLRFLKNSAFVFFGLVCKGVLALAVDRQLAVSLGPDAYGEFKYILAIVFVLSVFSSLGLNSSLVRYISTNISKHKFVVRIIKQAMYLVLGACVVTTSVFLIPNVQNWVGITNHSLFYLVLGAVFFVSINSLCQGVFSGLKDTIPKTIINDIFGPFLYFLIVYLHFRLQLSLHSLALLYLVYMISVSLLNILYLARFANRNLYSTEDSNTNLGREIFQYTWPIFLTSVVIAVTSSADKLILGQVVNKYELGIYFIAVTLSSIIPLVLTALLFLYLPIASKQFKRGHFKLMSFVSAYTSKWVMLMAFIPFWINFAYTEDVILLVFNEEYLRATLALKILSLAQFVNVTVGFTGQNLLAIGDSHAQMRIRLYGLVIGIGSGVYLASIYDIEGVAISVFITLVLTNLFQIIVLLNKYQFYMYKKTNLTSIISLLLFVVFSVFFHRIIVIDNVFLKIGIDVSFLVIWLIVSGQLTQKDIRMLRLLSRL